MNWYSYHTNGPDKTRRKVLPATCGLHRGPEGFTNLLVSMHGESLVFDTHVTGFCLIAIEEKEAKILRNIMTKWLA